MIILERGTIAQEGIGKPDFSREISSGRERPGLTLKYNQTLLCLGRVFTTIDSLYTNVTDPLAVGATAHLIESDTGIEAPVIIPKGYTLTAISAKYSFNQDAILWGYFEGQLYTNLGAPVGGSILYLLELLGMSSTTVDPLGESSHLYDIQVTNTGVADLEGGVSIWGILEAVGTEPLSKTKTIRCKFCGHEWDVLKGVTAADCPKCKKLNLYHNWTAFRGTV